MNQKISSDPVLTASGLQPDDDSGPLIQHEKPSFSCLEKGKPKLGSEPRLEGDMRRAWQNRDD